MQSRWSLVINAFKVVNIWFLLFVENATLQGVLAVVVALAMRLAVSVVRPYENPETNVKQNSMYNVVRAFCTFRPVRLSFCCVPCTRMGSVRRQLVHPLLTSLVRFPASSPSSQEIASLVFVLFAHYGVIGEGFSAAIQFILVPIPFYLSYQTWVNKVMDMVRKPLEKKLPRTAACLSAAAARLTAALASVKGLVTAALSYLGVTAVLSYISEKLFGRCFCDTANYKVRSKAVVRVPSIPTPRYSSTTPR